MNSIFADLASHPAMESAHCGVLEMHAEDAKARGIADGDGVEVFNEHRKIPLWIKVGATVPVGVAASRLGWNKLTKDGRCIKSPASERLTDLGGGPTFYSTLVEVCRV